MTVESASTDGGSLRHRVPGAELALSDEGLRRIGQLEVDLLQARRQAAQLRALLEEPPRSFVERSRRRSERALVTFRLTGLEDYASTLERRLRRERIYELERSARRIIAGPGRGGVEHALMHMERDVGEIAASFVAAKALMPFLDAYAKALGKKLGESTANLLTRLSLGSVARLAQGQPILIGTDRTVAVVFDPNLPDEARLALLDLDLTDPHLQGTVLRWDLTAERWQPLDLPVLEAKPLRRVALITAILSALPTTSAFVEGIGGSLGEKTADGLLRVRLKPRRRDGDGDSAKSESNGDLFQPVTIEVHPNVTEQELAALSELDLTAPHLQGRILRWDELSGEWGSWARGETRND